MNKQGFCVDKRKLELVYCSSISLLHPRVTVTPRSWQDTCQRRNALKFGHVWACWKGRLEGLRCFLPATAPAAPVLEYTTKVTALSSSWELQLSQGKLEQALLYITVPSCTQWEPRSSFIAWFCDAQVSLPQTFQFNELIALYDSPKHLLLTTGRDNIQLEKLSDPVWQLLHSDLTKCSEILQQICVKVQQ